MIRFAEKSEIPRINVLRKQVSDLHIAGRPETFKPGFHKEFADYLRVFFEEADRAVIVAECGGEICGFAMVRYIRREETLYCRAESYYEIDEFGVDAAHQRQGIATKLFDFMKQDAVSRGFARIDLNMWEFNETALAFYEAMGMKTYRRYMELKL